MSERTEEYQESILNELVSIRRLLQLITRDQLKRMLGEVISTELREKMWKLMDGTNSTIIIAEKLNSSPRAVQMFVKELEKHELVESKDRGYPTRTIPII
jgi:DNA-binding MarR family transcriptional regulator